MVEPGASSAPLLHHVGNVVKSIADMAEDFARSIDASWSGEIIHDSPREARVALFRVGGPWNPEVELVEPAGEHSPLHKFLARGGGLHHLCYAVNNLGLELTESRKRGGLIVKNPLPAVAFGGRRIAWVYTRHKLLLEYLELTSRNLG
jgi:methylmalonyl-CoA/ethylmalonyl-CoA epimerase